ncbi:hypothetical protein EBT16_13650, partial [bacterium]|nr:hypothetical protein [bacterium]
MRKLKLKLQGRRQQIEHKWHGNDSNNGTSPSTPWQTYAKVISHIGANSGGNYSILFRRGDTFRSATGITLTAPNVHFGAYGPLTTNSVLVQRPIISHFTVRWIAGGGSWSLVSGNTYSASVPASGTNNPSGATSIGFLRLDYDPLNPLRAQDNASNCGLDPWSFHVAGSTVYINLDGNNPNDFTIEAVPVNVSTPPYGIRIQNGSSGVWIDELRFDGWGAGTQGLTLANGNQANESGVVNEAG